MKYLSYLFLSLSILLGGCSTIDNLQLKAGYIKKDKIEKEIDNLKKQYQLQLNQISQDKTNIIDGEKQKEQKAANSFYVQSLIFGGIVNPTRTDILFNVYANDGWAALGYMQPDYTTLLNANKKLKEELDEQKTSIEKIKKEHQQTIEDNLKLAEETKKKEDKLKEDEDKLKTTQNQISEKNEEAKKKSDEIAALEKKRADREEEIKAIKTKFSVALGILSLIAMLVSVYIPVARGKAIIISIIAGIAAIGLWYIEPWMIGAFFGTVVALIILWQVIEHNKENNAATATYRALNEIKENSSDIWEKEIAPRLQEWQSKYQKDKLTGEIKTVPDPSIQKHIDDILMKVGDK